MSEMPKEIWTCYYKGKWDMPSLEEWNDLQVKYIRDDIHQAVVDGLMGTIESQKQTFDALLKKHAAMKESRDSLMSANEWRPIDTAPRDESTFLLMILHPMSPSFYSARYYHPEETFNGEITEYDGHVWVLNDDEKCLLCDEEDYNCYWMPLPKPPTESEDNDR